MERYFRAARDGLSDNEDMGCQSAWYMGSALGLYPIMGQDLYLLSAPLFRRAEIKLGASGKRLFIEAPAAGPDGSYIVSASLNGKPLDRAWVRHREIASGAVLRLELGQNPGEWGRQLPPPSPHN
jgi:putative alpha-1,2-mannosidase